MLASNTKSWSFLEGKIEFSSRVEELFRRKRTEELKILYPAFKWDFDRLKFSKKKPLYCEMIDKDFKNPNKRDIHGHLNTKIFRFPIGTCCGAEYYIASSWTRHLKKHGAKNGINPAETKAIAEDPDETAPFIQPSPQQLPEEPDETPHFLISPEDRVEGSSPESPSSPSDSEEELLCSGIQPPNPHQYGEDNSFEDEKGQYLRLDAILPQIFYESEFNHPSALVNPQFGCTNYNADDYPALSSLGSYCVE